MEGATRTTRTPTPAALRRGATRPSRPAGADQPESEFCSSTTVTSTAANGRNSDPAGDLDNNLTFRNNALAAATARELLRRQSPRQRRQRPRQRRVQRPTTRCSSSCASRCNGLAFNGSYQYALEELVGIPRLPFGRAASAAQCEHPARSEGAVGLAGPGRQRMPVRARPGRRPASHRVRLAIQRRWALPAAHHELRQRATGRHEQERSGTAVSLGSAPIRRPG